MMHNKIRIMSVSFWVKLLAGTSSHREFNTLAIQVFTIMAYMLTWAVFTIVYPLSISIYGPFRSLHPLIQYSMAPTLLWFVSTLGLVYGFQIHARLKEIREMNEKAAAIASILRRQKRFVRSESSEELSLDQADQDALASMQQSNESEVKTSRILKVLMFTEVLSAIVIVLQVSAKQIHCMQSS